MPIYEYECKNCGTRFEKMQPITSDPIKICPNCGEEQVRRVIQPVGVIFKGSGWYITDNRKSTSESSPPPAKSDTPTDTKAESTAEAKPDSKAGTKAEAKPESAQPAPTEHKSSGKSENPSGGKSAPPSDSKGA
jgi:putative FmdB family regulatory protein